MKKFLSVFGIVLIAMSIIPAVGGFYYYFDGAFLDNFTKLVSSVALSTSLFTVFGIFSFIGLCSVLVSNFIKPSEKSTKDKSKITVCPKCGEKFLDKK